MEPDPRDHPTMNHVPFPPHEGCAPDRFGDALRSVSREIARERRRQSVIACARVGAWFAAGVVSGIAAMHAAGFLK